MKKYLAQPDSNSMIFAEGTSDYVDARVLAAGVAESFTVPATARFVRLSTNDTLVYFNPNGTAAVPGADISNGSSSVPIKYQSRLMCVDGYSAISVVCAGAAVVTAEWFA